MTQQELEALLAQIAPNGQTERLEFTEQTVTKKVKRKVPATSEFGQPTEEEVEVRVPTRTWIDRGTGRTVTVEVNSDNTYTKIYDGTDPKNQGAPAGPKPGEAKPRQTRVNPSDETRIQEFDPDANGGQGAWVDGGPNAAGIRAAAERNKPGAPTLKPDGKGGTIAVQTMPDGSIKTTPLPGVPSDKPAPERVTVEGVVYERGPDGTYKPAAGLPGATPPPAGAPKPSGRIGEAAADLIAFDQWLDAEMRKPGSKLTPAQADKLREARRAFWRTAIEEQNNVINAQRGVYGDQVQQRGQSLQDLGNRRSSATTVSTSANSGFLPYLDKMGEGGGALLARALVANRQGQQDFITRAGANRQMPEIPLPPGLQQIAGQSLPGTPPAVMPTVPAFMQLRAPQTPPPSSAEVAAQTNAVIPQTVSNLGAAAAGRPSPVFRPQPVVSAPAAAPAPVAAPPAPPVLAPPIRDDWSQQPSPGVAPLPVPAVAPPAASDAPPVIVPPESSVTTSDPADPYITKRNTRSGSEETHKRSEWEQLQRINSWYASGWEDVVPEIQQGPDPSLSVPPVGQMMPTQTPAFMQARVGQPAQTARPAQPDQRVIDEWIADPTLDNNALAQVLQEAYPGYDVSHLVGSRAA